MTNSQQVKVTDTWTHNTFIFPGSIVSEDSAAFLIEHDGETLTMLKMRFQGEPVTA